MLFMYRANAQKRRRGRRTFIDPTGRRQIVFNRMVAPSIVLVAFKASPLIKYFSNLIRTSLNIFCKNFAFVILVYL